MTWEHEHLLKHRDIVVVQENSLFLRDNADVFRGKKGHILQITFKEFSKSKAISNDHEMTMRKKRN